MDDLVEKLEIVAAMATIANHYSSDGSMRLMPAEGVADIVCNALSAIDDLKSIEQGLREQLARAQATLAELKGGKHE
jgi:hypothetical protein